jgi:hypothetical protein
MRSQLRFVMHADDEAAFVAELLRDPAVLLIDGPRWKTPEPVTSRSLSSIGSTCIVWSPDDLPKLTAEFIPSCRDWYCRSEHATMQFWRSRMIGTFLTDGRLAVSTDAARAFAAAGVERRYKVLRRTIKKTYANAVVAWTNPMLPIAPSAPGRSANPSKPDSALWVGPRAMAWLLADSTRRIKPLPEGPVEGFVA